MASTNSVWVMLVMLLGPNTMAGALGVPVMTIGVKRFTTEVLRGAGGRGRLPAQGRAAPVGANSHAAQAQCWGKCHSLNWRAGQAAGWAKQNQINEPRIARFAGESRLLLQPFLLTDECGCAPSGWCINWCGVCVRARVCLHVCVVRMFISSQPRPPHPAGQGMLMDVFRIGFKHGFNVPSLSEHSLLNSGFRLFLASGEREGQLCGGGSRSGPEWNVEWLGQEGGCQCAASTALHSGRCLSVRFCLLPRPRQALILHRPQTAPCPLLAFRLPHLAGGTGPHLLPFRWRCACWPREAHAELQVLGPGSSHGVRGRGRAQRGAACEP